MSDLPSFPLIDKTDHEILMHKDAHFGGSFPLMIEYYEKNEKGTVEEFSLSRIHALSQMEEKHETFLSQELLTEEEKEAVILAKDKYNSLRKVYELPFSSAHKVADLILSESLEAQDEIDAIVNSSETERAAIIPSLLQLVREDTFYNPLFPGYGLAPLHAMHCLGILKTKEAIIPIFESLSKTEFFGEEEAIHALFQIGNPAKEFLLKVVKKTPISQENENAAIALLPFREDPLVSSTCLDLLFLPEVQSSPLLFSYLLLSYSGTQNPEEQERFCELIKSPYIIKENKDEINDIIERSKK